MDFKLRKISTIENLHKFSSNTTVPAPIPTLGSQQLPNAYYFIRTNIRVISSITKKITEIAIVSPIKKLINTAVIPSFTIYDSDSEYDPEPDPEPDPDPDPYPAPEPDNDPDPEQRATQTVLKENTSEWHLYHNCDRLIRTPIEIANYITSSPSYTHLNTNKFTVNKDGVGGIEIRTNSNCRSHKKGDWVKATIIECQVFKTHSTLGVIYNNEYLEYENNIDAQRVRTINLNKIYPTHAPIISYSKSGKKCNVIITRIHSDKTADCIAYPLTYNFNNITRPIKEKDASIWRNVPLNYLYGTRNLQYMHHLV